MRQDTHILEVSTKYFTLTYLKDQPFIGPKMDPMKFLKVTLISREKDRNKDWYYGHPEIKTYDGTLLAIDDIVLKYASPQSGVMALQVLECEHGQKLWLNMTEERYYVQWFGK